MDLIALAVEEEEDQGGLNLFPWSCLIGTAPIYCYWNSRQARLEATANRKTATVDLFGQSVPILCKDPESDDILSN